MNESHAITSAEQVQDIEKHFRLTAGPGAGKTYWLSEYVRYVLGNSVRVNEYAHIACITYTQIGAETLRRQLGSLNTSVEVSTIHGFLYKYLVRPYAHLLAEYELRTERLRGHDVLKPSTYKGQSWLENLGLSKKLWFAQPALSELLEKNLRWVRDESGSLQLKFDGGDWSKINGGKKKYADAEALLEYKRSHWRNGRIDHEDVVYFAHQLLKAHPPLYQALACKFPYIFLDEYQDTSALQAEIIESLPSEGATVGVIGDRNQAIFEFNDARPLYLERFAPKNCVHYVIEDNRRSTPCIVNTLNYLRKGDDIEQSSLRSDQGKRPIALVGEIERALDYAKEEVSPLPLHLMARSHKDVSTLVSLGASANLDPSLRNALGNDSEREVFFALLCRSVRQLQDGNLQEALREALSVFHGRRCVSPLQSNREYGSKARRELAVLLMWNLYDILKNYPECNVLDAYSFLNDRLEEVEFEVKLKGVKSGAFAKIAPTLRLQDLFSSVAVQSASGLIRTIHGFKGDEAEAILIYISQDQLVDRLCAPRDDELTRLLYVALSRARSHAYIALPELGEQKKAQISSVGFDVVHLD